MVYLLELFTHLFFVLHRHAFRHYEAEAAFAELVEQHVLTDDRIHILRQVCEHVVIDPCAEHTEHSRYHQQNRKDNDRDAIFNYRSGKSHFPSSLSLLSYYVQYNITTAPKNKQSKKCVC